MIRILRSAVQVVLAAVLVLIIFLVGAFIVMPKLLGWVPLTVLTGSMDPTIPPGSQIVVDNIEGDGDAIRGLHAGDVITFMPEPNNPMLITHRIIEVSYNGLGEPVFTTQGDANPSPDPEPVTEQQVKGKLLYHVPYLGFVTQAVPNSGKGLGITIAALTLLGYGAWQVLAAFRRRPAASDAEPESAEVADGEMPADAPVQDVGTPQDADLAVRPYRPRHAAPDDELTSDQDSPMGEAS